MTAAHTALVIENARDEATGRYWKRRPAPLPAPDGAGYQHQRLFAAPWNALPDVNFTASMSSCFPMTLFLLDHQSFGTRVSPFTPPANRTAATFTPASERFPTMPDLHLLAWSVSVEVR
ncbi:hypothetical protein [Streptomyces eurythermus]|uniref:hypothetical protein n=1 Tax=Streptomyces eurythermus TaxID=42237 RepID=UPI003D9EE27B